MFTTEMVCFISLRVNSCNQYLFTKGKNMNDRAASAEIISNNIKRLRGEADWSQAVLAKKSGVSPAAISLIEKGERIPSLVVTRKLAAAFKVSEAELTGAQAQSTNQINKDAHAFFRDYGEINDLDTDDQEIIKDLVKRFRERKNDKSGK